MTKNVALTLDVETRECNGTASSRRLRRQGKVPVVMYSHGKVGQNLIAETKAITNFVHSHGIIAIQNTTTKETTQAIVKDVAYNALTLEVMHVDLQEVHSGDIVSAEVSIVAVGTPACIAQGAILEQIVHNVHVRCPSDNIPEVIKVDVSGMEIGTRIHFGDIELPQGVTSSFDKTASVFVVVEAAEEVAEETTEEATEEAK